MTYDQDPARWTSSPDDAPELLRGAFSAGRNEGPSQAQTRALALKIAALSAGGAVAIGTAKATATGNVAASAATWSIGKLAGVIALVGSVATGAVVWQRSSQPESNQSTPAASTSPAAEEQPGIAAPQAPVVVGAASGTPREDVRSAKQAAPATGAPSVGESAKAGSSTESRDVEPRAQQPSASRQAASQVAQPATQVNGSKPSARTGSASSSATHSGASSKRAANDSSSARQQRAAEVVSSSGTPAKVSEVDLLQRARSALRSRPREAYRLTEQHRQLYPAGEYAQERDALAIQALLGAGETEMARDLAVSFIKAHPSSPHAHRFREAMGIR